MLVGEKGNLLFRFDDGAHGHMFNATMDKACTARLLTKTAPGKRHHIGAVVDGGPGIAFFIVDGGFCDYQWYWIPDGIEAVPSSPNFTVSTRYDGKISRVD